MDTASRHSTWTGAAAVAGVAASTSLLFSYWLLSPRAPVLTEEDRERHFYHLDRTTTDLPEPPGQKDWTPPHRVRLSKKRLDDAERGGVDVVVVGSGLGGLTVASLLARRGHRVLVLERHDQAGGCLHTFSDQHFEFDVGLHYVGGDVGNPWAPLRKVYDAVTGGVVEWCAMDDPYDVAVCTGTRGTDDEKEVVEFYGDYRRTERELTKNSDAAEKRSVRRFFRAMDTDLSRMAGWLVSKTLTPFWRRLLHPLLTWPARGVLNVTTHHALTERFGVVSPRLRGVLCYLYGDYGLRPKRSAWGVHALIMNHWKGGAYYPYGGSSTLAMGACEVVRKHGGAVLVNAAVERIVVENGRAVGVELSRYPGRVVRAREAVVSDAGFRNTLLRLLTREEAVRATASAPLVEALSRGDANVVRGAPDDEKKEEEEGGGMGPSVTLLNLFVGLDGSCEELGIPATNAWITPSWDLDGNMDEFLNDSENKGRDVAVPIVFVGSNSAKDHSYERRYGKHRGSVMVLAPVHYGWFAEWENTRVHARGKDYEETKRFWTDRLLAVLYDLYPKCRGRVVHSDFGTPLSNNFYLGVNRGEVYGLTHTVDRTWTHARELSATTNIKGLYMTGQDLVTSGVSAALLSGVMTVGAISPLALLSHLHNLV